jgi:peptide/nickel transport system permease protein
MTMNAETAEIASTLAPRTQPSRRAGALGRLLRIFGRNRPALVALVIILIASFFGVLGPYLVLDDPEAPSADRLQSPSISHPLGTDNLGRDIYSRIAAGTRTSMAVTAMAVLMSVLIGVPIGLVAGYAGGWLDLSLMRIIDALYAIPSIVLAMALLVILGNGIVNVSFAIALVFVPVFARVVRSESLVVGSLDYVTAARAQGASGVRILLKHIWPNVRSPVIVQASLVCGFAILLEAGLSYLGFGVNPAVPTWGRMTRAGYGYISQAPWMALAPGLTIFFVVLSFNILGDALRDALDPRTRSEKV